MSDPIGNPDWRLSAACSEQDAALFFAGGGRPDLQEQAKAICATCPVVEPCRALIDETEAGTHWHLWAGVWGGETRADRRRRRGVA